MSGGSSAWLLMAMSALMASGVVGFKIMATVNNIGLGRTVNVTVEDVSQFQPTANGTVFWPFVNGTQFGSFVTCRVTGRPSALDGGCSVLIPLPYAGTANIQLAVLSAGRDWQPTTKACDPTTRDCGYQVGTPLPTAPMLVSLSNTIDINVRYRQIKLPPTASQIQHDVCIDWEPWHTLNNAGRWLGRPGASAVPLVGMYGSSHPGVARQHAIWLVEAGINCIEIDWSNSLWNHARWADRGTGVQQLSNATAATLHTYSKMKQEGHDVPKALFMVGLQNGPPATPSEVGLEAAWIRDNLIAALGAESFVFLDGKPLLLVLYCGAKTPPDPSITAAVSANATFTVRYMGTQLQNNPSLGLKYGFWSWMDGSISPVPTLRANGSTEALTVTPAFFAAGGWLAPESRGQLQGSTLIAEMALANKRQPTVTLVCQWNEWLGQPDGTGQFVDAYNLTYTNDLEPTSLAECGGYQHADDAGQLPICDTGWGFFNLNLLSALLSTYRDAISSEPVASSSTVIRIAKPMTPFKYTASPTSLRGYSLEVEWAVAGPGTTFEIKIDDITVKSVVNESSTTIDLSAMKEGVHSLTVEVVDSFSNFLLSRESRDIDSSSKNKNNSLASHSIKFNFSKSPAVNEIVESSATGFINQSRQSAVEYSPTTIQENGVYYTFFCANGGYVPEGNNGVVANRVIRVVTSSDGVAWSNSTVVLEPDSVVDQTSTCDPSIIKFRGTYFMYYTCENTCSGNHTNSSDNYHNSRICVALSDKITGPYHKIGTPIIADISCGVSNKSTCSRIANTCVGQPSAVVIDENIAVYFSANNPFSQIRMATSNDGVNFGAPMAVSALGDMANIDVRTEIDTGQLMLLQGAVGSSTIMWSLSDADEDWIPMQAAHSLNVHRNGCQNCSNFGPGIVSLPDGTFSERTFALYGSSPNSPAILSAIPADWQIFRSDFGVGPLASGCRSCAPNGCDHACSKAKSITSRGKCAVPNSTDPGDCCACESYQDDLPCQKCAAVAGGCVELCRQAKAGVAGMCKYGDADPQGLCCECFK